MPRAVKTADRPRDQWLEVAVPAIVAQDTFARVRQRPEDNKRFAARNTKVPSLLQGLAACSACGYGYYRTSARTTSRKIYYYRCLGSDDYRYELTNSKIRCYVTASPPALLGARNAEAKAGAAVLAGLS